MSSVNGALSSSSLDGYHSGALGGSSAINVKTGDGHLGAADPTSPTGEPETRTLGIVGASLIMVSTILGAGVVAFPNGFLSAGIVASFVLIVLSALYSVFTTRMLFGALSSCPKKVGSTEELVEYYVAAVSKSQFAGKVARKISEFTFFLSMSAPCITYLCVIGDSVTPLVRFVASKCKGGDIGDPFWADRTFIISCFAICIVFPINTQRDISKLKYTSSIAISAIAYIMVLVPVLGIIGSIPGSEKYGFNKIPGPGIKDTIWINKSTYHGTAPVFFMALPVFAFAFGCQPVICAIYNSMGRPTTKQTDCVIFLSFIFVSLAYSLVGFFGNMLFGDKTAPDIINNLGHGKGIIEPILGWIGKGMVGLQCTLVLPGVSFVMRSSLNSVLFGTQETNSILHLTATLIVFGGNLLVAILLPDIIVVFGFTVSVGIVFIVCYYSLHSHPLPPIINLVKIEKDRKEGLITNCWAWCLRILPIVIIIVSLVLMITGPVTTSFKLYYGGE